MDHSDQEINPLFQAGIEMQNAISKLNWKFCFIGGLAVIRWGEIRMTQDIDLCLMCGFGNEEKFIEPLLAKFKSRIADPFQFALENRVLLLSASNGVSVDISLSGLPFEDEMINRATEFSFYPNCELRTCSAEDLIVLKAFAGRTKDWLDIETIIKRQVNSLDNDYIFEQLAPLIQLKNDLKSMNKLENIFSQYLNLK